jgi:hypothetical protein
MTLRLSTSKKQKNHKNYLNKKLYSNMDRKRTAKLINLETMKLTVSAEMIIK